MKYDKYLDEKKIQQRCLIAKALSIEGFVVWMLILLLIVFRFYFS